jgi:uncharacterized protein (TIGR02391 family)
MPDEPALQPPVLRGIAEVLGDTHAGLTNAEIDRLLSQSKIPDPTPRGTPGLTYVAINKRDRLERALNAQQQGAGRANCVLLFVKNAMSPARFRADPTRFEALREELNVALAFAGLTLLQDGRLARVRRADTLSEARRRALRLQEKLLERGTHPRLLTACVQEIEDENYFHAVLEASKSLATEIRVRTKRTEDGVPLINAVFEPGKQGYPLLALTAMRSETERSRQRGLADGLRSIFSSIRNPTAHEPRIESPMTEQDALDAFAWMSYLHRRLDDCDGADTAQSATTRQLDR